MAGVLIMPRKEDGMLFEVHPAPLKDKAGNNYVYVRPFALHKRTPEDFDEYCSKHYAMRPGEMLRDLGIFMEATKIWLGEGDRVETPFGSFAPKLKLLGEHTIHVCTAIVRAERCTILFSVKVP